MKLSILKQILLLSLIVLIGVFCGKESPFSNFVDGYIVGSFKCTDQEKRGFCIILENNVDSIYTFSISDDLFDFPPELFTPPYNSNNGGPHFFPENDREKYKITFKYRTTNEFEAINFHCLSLAYELSFNWDIWDQTILEDIIKTYP